MNDEQWAVVADYLRHWWPGEFSDAAAEAYRTVLGRHDVEAVGGALQSKLREGGRFRPSVAELVAVLGGGGWRPATPDEAWNLIEQAIRRVGRSVVAEDFDERHQAAVDWLAEQDPAVALWAARRGLCGQGSLGHEPVFGEHGGAVRGRLAKDYRTVVEQVEERVALGKPAVTDRMLLVRGTGVGGGMAELVESLRPEETRELEAGE